MNKKDTQIIEKLMQADKAEFYDNLKFADKVFANIDEEDISQDLLNSIQQTIKSRLEKRMHLKQLWFAVKAAAACFFIILGLFAYHNISNRYIEANNIVSSDTGFWDYDLSDISYQLTQIEQDLQENYYSNENGMNSNLLEIESRIISETSFWKG